MRVFVDAFGQNATRRPLVDRTRYEDGPRCLYGTHDDKSVKVCDDGGQLRRRNHFTKTAPYRIG